MLELRFVQHYYLVGFSVVTLNILHIEMFYFILSDSSISNNFITGFDSNGLSGSLTTISGLFFAKKVGVKFNDESA